MKPIGILIFIDHDILAKQFSLIVEYERHFCQSFVHFKDIPFNCIENQVIIY